MVANKDHLCDIWRGKYEQLHSLCETAIKLKKFEYFEAWFESHRIFLEDMRNNIPLEYEPAACINIFSEDSKIGNCNE